MLTAKQHELLRFIQRKLEETGISPSFEEMKDALDLKSKSGVHRLISALEERGFIRRLPNRARALEVLRHPEDSTPAVRKPRSEPRNDNVVDLRRAATARAEPANDVIDLHAAGTGQRHHRSSAARANRRRHADRGDRGPVDPARPGGAARRGRALCA